METPLHTQMSGPCCGVVPLLSIGSAVGRTLWWSKNQSHCSNITAPMRHSVRALHADCAIAHAARCGMQPNSWPSAAGGCSSGWVLAVDVAAGSHLYEPRGCQSAYYFLVSLPKILQCALGMV